MTYLFCFTLGLIAGCYVRRRPTANRITIDVKHDDGHVERQMVKVWRRMKLFSPPLEG